MNGSCDRDTGNVVYNPNFTPSGSRLLSSSEVLSLRLKALKSWDRPLEVLPLRYGKDVATIVTLFSSLLINHQSRLFFNLFTRAGMAYSLVTNVVLPTTLTYEMFNCFVFKRILSVPSNSMLYPDCNTCLQLRGALIMSTCGLFLPFGFSYLSSAITALITRSYPVPDPFDSKSMWRMFRLYSKSLRTVGTSLLLSQSIIGAGLVFCMMKSNQQMLKRYSSSGPPNQEFIETIKS
ncbi:hypothetical protein MN116_007148 [Schistosoma mekongi]|uniref:Transmembrane protein 126A n=1 Tax=Schistosoma mekongi TaxID=38744 RepID=A0AAE2D3C2_SCHME|nr:hypothetical protein MN116_007148 [Schistosoma mekongi]